MADNNGLTDEERAELEQLRAEKAERAQAARDAEARERGRALMEPDEDDLKMPLGQKVVIFAVVGIALVWLAVTVLG